MRPRFARQQWRAWIETALLALLFEQQGGSPASNGGRGLKPASPAAPHHPAGFARQQWRAWIETTRPASPCRWPMRFARQQWRAWIETSARRLSKPARRGSPASNGGRGLKQPGGVPGQLGRCWFARQQWRAWIETSGWWGRPRSTWGSPASNGGRGLKQRR